VQDDNKQIKDASTLCNAKQKIRMTDKSKPKSKRYAEAHPLTPGPTPPIKSSQCTPRI
jgi:hypothetical protein